MHARCSIEQVRVCKDAFNMEFNVLPLHVVIRKEEVDLLNFIPQNPSRQKYIEVFSSRCCYLYKTKKTAFIEASKEIV